MKYKNLIPWEEVKNEGLTPQEVATSDREANYKILMRKLKYARLEKKLTQQQLAELSGVPRTTIAKLENGYQNVSIQKLQQIVEPMGIELDIQLKDR